MKENKDILQNVLTKLKSINSVKRITGHGPIQTNKIYNEDLKEMIETYQERLKDISFESEFFDEDIEKFIIDFKSSLKIFLTDLSENELLNSKNKKILEILIKELNNIEYPEDFIEITDDGFIEEGNIEQPHFKRLGLSLKNIRNKKKNQEKVKTPSI